MTFIAENQIRRIEVWQRLYCRGKSVFFGGVETSLLKHFCVFLFLWQKKSIKSPARAAVNSPGQSEPANGARG